MNISRTSVYGFATTILFCFSFYADAQNNQENLMIKSSDSALGKHSYLKLALSYLSNSVYYGRRDSAVVPYITPSIRYVHKSGLYAEGSLSYLPVKKESRVDMASIGLSYNHENVDSSFKTELYANKYFTNSNSFSVKSALKADVGAALSYNPGLISFFGEVYGVFSGKADLTTGFGIFKDINLGEKDEWTLSPSAMINAGTDNFYTTYFGGKKFSQRRRIITTAVITPIILKNGFGVLDYELSAPLEYETNKFGFYFTPAFSIPVHPVTYSLNNGITYRTEQLKNSFYLELGLYFKVW